jgi:hypothetical protein
VGPHYRCHGGVSGAGRCYRLSEGLGPVSGGDGKGWEDDVDHLLSLAESGQKLPMAATAPLASSGLPAGGNIGLSLTPTSFDPGQQEEEIASDSSWNFRLRSVCVNRGG